mgnify:CR=1 FL=1
MDARLKAYMKVSLKILLWAAVFLSVLLVVYKLFFYILPFAIAFIIASSIEPAIRYLINKARMKRKLAAPLVLLAFFGIFGTILTILAIRLISEIADLTQQLPQYYNKIYGSLKMIIDRAAELYVELPKEITGQVEQVMSNFSKSLVDMINAFFKAILNTAVSIPDALIFLIVTILATYFLVVDRETLLEQRRPAPGGGGETRLGGGGFGGVALADLLRRFAMAGQAEEHEAQGGEIFHGGFHRSLNRKPV